MRRTANWLNFKCTGRRDGGVLLLLLLLLLLLQTCLFLSSARFRTLATSEEDYKISTFFRECLKRARRPVGGRTEARM